MIARAQAFVDGVGVDAPRVRLEVAVDGEVHHNRRYRHGLIVHVQ